MVEKTKNVYKWKESVTKKPTTQDIEIAVAEYFNPRINLVVPNVSWGLFNHECDLLVMTKAGYLYEIEIKISVQDLKRDKLKPHNHKSNKIKKLYFAIPDWMLKYKDLIREDAGILSIGTGGWLKTWTVHKEREGLTKNNYKVTEAEKYQIARLGALRIFGMKRINRDLVKELNQLKQQPTQTERKAWTPK